VVATTVTTSLLLLGGAFSWFAHSLANYLWLTGAAVGVGLSASSLIAGLRSRRLGVDAIALLALAGAVALHEYFAAAVLSVMLATGAMLEARAAARAVRDLSILASRAPTFARRIRGAEIERIPVTRVQPGDALVLATGDVVPVDGTLTSSGRFDESAITGEALPVRRGVGDTVVSGVVSLDAGVSMAATGSAETSTYATIVALTEQAQATSAPFVRLADRWAFAFIPITLGLAALAWMLGGAARAVAVLVVATPCPLILAAPIALLSGIARCARQGVIVKNGQALEQLARARVLLIDKTGTLTEGRPRVTAVDSVDESAASVLAMAASLERYSTHVLAPTVVKEARSRGVAIPTATDISELQGKGVEGDIDGSHVRVGAADWVTQSGTNHALEVWRTTAREQSASLVVVSRNGRPVGAIYLKDPLRRSLAATVGRLRRSGLRRMVLITGDHPAAAHHVARIAGVDDVRCEVTPAQKLTIVREERAFGPTVMVGDGINDAPALAGADVGVALAARGASAASQAADVVLVHDRVDALADAFETAQTSLSIARQSVLIGMGLSGVAMLIATQGLLTPAAGAILQEGIDLVALLWALRVADRHSVTSGKAQT
jgi:heavy metal translocating P-type ATPase